MKIMVVGYKNGKDVRHEYCFDIFEADVVAEDMKDSLLYDQVRIITEEDNGSQKTV